MHCLVHMTPRGISYLHTWHMHTCTHMHSQHTHLQVRCGALWRHVAPTESDLCTVECSTPQICALCRLCDTCELHGACVPCVAMHEHWHLHKHTQSSAVLETSFFVYSSKMCHSLCGSFAVLCYAPQEQDFTPLCVCVEPLHKHDWPVCLFPGLPCL